MLLRHCSFIDVPLTATELNAFADVLRHRVTHLVRSVVELADALVESPGDPDFELAVEENAASIALNEARVRDVEALIAALRAAAAAGRPVAFVPDSEWASVAGPEGDGRVVVGLVTAPMPRVDVAAPPLPRARAAAVAAPSADTAVAAAAALSLRVGEGGDAGLSL